MAYEGEEPSGTMFREIPLNGEYDCSRVKQMFKTSPGVHVGIANPEKWVHNEEVLLMTCLFRVECSHRVNRFTDSLMEHMHHCS